MATIYLAKLMLTIHKFIKSLNYQENLTNSYKFKKQNKIYNSIINLEMIFDVYSFS